MTFKTDIAKANNLAKKFFLGIGVVLILAYLIQFVQGDKSLPVFLLITFSLVIPISLCFLLFKTDPESVYIKHVIGIGFGIFYLISCFTTQEQIVFVYAVPMIIAISIYSDRKFSMIVNGLATVVAVCHALWLAARTGFAKESLATMEIEIGAIIFIALYSLISNTFVGALNSEKLSKINEAGAKTETMLSEVKNVSDALFGEIASLSDDITELSASSQETLAAMHEVESGTADTAESIQNQMAKTEEISAQITHVSEVTQNIADSVASTVEAIHEGRDNLHILMDNSKVSGEAGVRAISEVTELKQITDKMEEIVNLIKSIASKTSLLSLNASIEAARAGDAGRGFSVVAREISTLATQTKEATDNISRLIDSVTDEMETVGNVIGTLVDSNNTQNKSADVMAESFEKIVVNARLIRSGSNDLNVIVKNLDGANAEIVDNIQTISSITEEVTAHTATTCEATEANEKTLEEILKVVEEILASAERLKEI